MSQVHVTTDLQAYRFMFHFTRQNVKIAEYHDDSTRKVTPTLLKGGDGDVCDWGKCANYLNTISRAGSAKSISNVRSQYEAASLRMLVGTYA
jgi:hypothetical protein